MNTTLRCTTFVVVLLLASAMQMSAQRSTVDPRPLHSTTLATPPVWTHSSLGFGSLQPAHSISSRGVIVDRARIEPYPVESLGDATFAKRENDGFTPDFSGLRAIHIDRRGDGSVRWMTGDFGYLSDYSGLSGKGFSSSLASADRHSIEALGFVSTWKTSIALENPSEELSPMATYVDALGYTHVRLEQLYQGLPVWGSDMYVHANRDGRVYLFNGSYQPTPVGVNTTPSVSTSAALDKVIVTLMRTGAWAPITEKGLNSLGLSFLPAVRTVIYPVPGGAPVLAYEIAIHPNITEFYYYIVDAHSGKIINRISGHCSLRNHDHPGRPMKIDEVSLTENSDRGLAAAGTFADASANDLNGVSRQVRVYHSDNGTYYSVWDLANINLGKSQLPDRPDGGGITLSANNKDVDDNTKLLHVSSSDNTWADPSGISAHYNMKVAYDYFKSSFTRKAIDDADASIISVIHGTEDGQKMDNAFWNGRFMVYGDGLQAFKPLAGGLDVAGHEMSHGVIGSTAGLIYQFQSGALNESFADVFGIMIDRNNFMIGEDVMLPGQGVALRDFANPANTQVYSAQPGHMNEFRTLDASKDNGGVHINSGIPNKACYNIIQAIGREKTEQIYYRALTKYLNRNSQFIDCRNACEQAARDLYTATEVTAVGSGFSAVGIGAGVGTDPGGNDIPPVSGGVALMAFILGDGTVGLYNPVTTQAVTFNSPVAVARIDNQNGENAQLTTPLNGLHLYFINNKGHLVSVDIKTGDVAEFDLNLQNDGDLWNAAVSPDDKYVAITSAYVDDANIYVSDGTGAVTIPLLPESTQSGIEIKSIRYADAFKWSPNYNEPRIGFDALNSLDIADQRVDYWSIYEIDFSVQKIYSLLPAQPEDVSAGNITYSNTDPDVVAFNVIDQGVFDTYLADLSDNGVAALGIPNFTISGNPINDGERPTFSPDDKYVAFTSKFFSAIVVYDLAGKQVAYVQFQAPLYNLHWFTNGGSIPGLGVEDASIAEGSLEVLPNPATDQTTLGYSLTRPTRVTIDIFDARGSRLERVVDEDREPGSYSAQVATAGIPSGAYMVSMRLGNRTITRRLVVSH